MYFHRINPYRLLGRMGATGGALGRRYTAVHHFCQVFRIPVELAAVRVLR